jgi:hypothetical protein
MLDSSEEKRIEKVAKDSASQDDNVCEVGVALNGSNVSFKRTDNGSDSSFSYVGDDEAETNSPVFKQCSLDALPDDTKRALGYRQQKPCCCTMAPDDATWKYVPGKSSLDYTFRRMRIGYGDITPGDVDKDIKPDFQKRLVKSYTTLLEEGHRDTENNCYVSLPQTGINKLKPTLAEHQNAWVLKACTEDRPFWRGTLLGPDAMRQLHVKALVTAHKRNPTLAVILVTDDKTAMLKNDITTQCNEHTKELRAKSQAKQDTDASSCGRNRK